MRRLKIICMTSIIILIASFSYANVGIKNMVDSLDLNSNKKVYASSTEVSINTEFYILFNLSKIEYNEFKVKIINESNAVASEVPSEAKNVSVASKEISFNINKETISLNKIGVAYTAPGEESNLRFRIEITNLEDNLNKWKNEIATIDSDLVTLNETLKTLKQDLEEAKKINKSNKENANVVENTVIEQTTNEIQNTETNMVINNTEAIAHTEKIEKEIAELEKTIEKNKSKKLELEEKIKSYTEEKLEEIVNVNVTNNTEKDQIPENEMKEKMEQEFKEREMSQMKKMMQEVENLEGNLQKAKNQISELTNTNTYQGSQNNYLSSLSITNVAFKSEFKKTNLTYFAEVDSTVTDLTVNATPEDTSAIVTIYGNTDLKVGQNKVIVSITADDGSTKTYKIYVEKKG